MHVLGAGSMGCLWAAALSRAGTEARLLLRPGSAKLGLCKSGKVLVRVEAGQACEEVAVDAEAVSDTGAVVKQVLVVTKAYSALDALEMLAPRLKRGAVIVVLSNGALALREQIAETASLVHTNLILGITTHGAWSRAPFHVVHAGSGQTRLGTVRPFEQNVYHSALRCLETAGLGAVDEGLNIERCLWLKLAANAAINPLTALREKPNGFLLSCAQARRQISQVCKEVASIADALRQCRGEDARLTCAHLEEFVVQTAKETAENRSSMLQDIEAGRLTEIDYLNGWVSSKAQEMGLDAAMNAELAALIKAKEAARPEMVQKP